jgi:hypothetical protein
MRWLMANWEWIVAGAVLTVSILNLVTSHFGEGHPRLKGALLFVVDLLSILVSRGSTGARSPDRLRGLRLKLPLLQVSPEAELRTRRVKSRAGIPLERIGLVFIAALLLAACGGGPAPDAGPRDAAVEVFMVDAHFPE